MPINHDYQPPRRVEFDGSYRWAPGDAQGIDGRRSLPRLPGAKVVAAFMGVMATASPQDQAVMGDPGWQQLVKGIWESLGSGIDGWVDESLASLGSRDDVDLAAVSASVTCYHTLHDRNAPIAAARRLLGHGSTVINSAVPVGVVGL